MHLVDMARSYIEQTAQRSFKERFIRGLLARTLPHPGWFRLAIKAAPLGRPWVTPHCAVLA
jgi:glycolate oxidase iron-sulfur subunit